MGRHPQPEHRRACCKVLTDDHADLVREAVSFLCHQIMEAEVSAQIAAGLGERAPAERTSHRNGYRERRFDTRAGTLELFIPRVRQGSYFPSFLEPRTRAEQALVSVVMESYVNGEFDPCHCYDPCGEANTCPILVDAGPPPLGCDAGDGGP